jgi:hypothetical protein
MILLLLFGPLLAFLQKHTTCVLLHQGNIRRPAQAGTMAGVPARVSGRVLREPPDAPITWNVKSNGRHGLTNMLAEASGGFLQEPQHALIALLNLPRHLVPFMCLALARFILPPHALLYVDILDSLSSFISAKVLSA